ncbi:MAG: MerR family transcriptional regulator [Burkholderiales bacterium]|nr:MerR family transcriptional regulator [Burkholderiales bacterium]
MSVRTLHHYDTIGLLAIGPHPGGARIYGRQDFLRLHRIQVLKQIGYSLSEIRCAIDDVTVAPLESINQQAQLLDAQAKRARALSDSLKYLANRLTAGTAVEASDWLSLLEMMMLYQRHLTEDEVQVLRSPTRRAAHEIETQRSLLVAEVGECMRRNVRTDSPQARALAWRWVHMVIDLTSNNAALAESSGHCKSRKSAQEIVGIDASMFKWIGKLLCTPAFTCSANTCHRSKLRDFDAGNWNIWTNGQLLLDLSVSRWRPVRPATPHRCNCLLHVGDVSGQSSHLEPGG